MRNPFKLIDVKDLMYRFNNEELTYNELTEELNEIAKEWHREKIKKIARLFDEYKDTEGCGCCADSLHLDIREDIEKRLGI